MNPEIDMIQIMRLPTGRWSWEVDFLDHSRDEEGFVATFELALLCVRSALASTQEIAQ